MFSFHYIIYFHLKKNVEYYNCFQIFGKKFFRDAAYDNIVKKHEIIVQLLLVVYHGFIHVIEKVCTNFIGRKEIFFRKKK